MMVIMPSQSAKTTMGLQWCCIGISKNNNRFTQVLHRNQRAYNGFTMVLQRNQQESGGFTMVLHRNLTKHACVIMVLHGNLRKIWFNCGVAQESTKKHRCCYVLHRNQRKGNGFIVVSILRKQNFDFDLGCIVKHFRNHQKAQFCVYKIARDTLADGFDGKSDDVLRCRTIATDGCVG